MTPETQPQRKVQPVDAWAYIPPEGDLDIRLIYWHESNAVESKERTHAFSGKLGRVIKVRVVPVADEDKGG